MDRTQEDVTRLERIVFELTQVVVAVKLIFNDSLCCSCIYLKHPSIYFLVIFCSHVYPQGLFTPLNLGAGQQVSCPWVAYRQSTNIYTVLPWLPNWSPNRMCLLVRKTSGCRALCWRLRRTSPFCIWSWTSWRTCTQTRSCSTTGGALGHLCVDWQECRPQTAKPVSRLQAISFHFLSSTHECCLDWIRFLGCGTFWMEFNSYTSRLDVLFRAVLPRAV